MTLCVISSFGRRGALGFAFSGFGNENFNCLTILEAVKTGLCSSGLEDLRHGLDRQSAVLNPIWWRGWCAGYTRQKFPKSDHRAGILYPRRMMQYVGWPLRPIRRKRIQTMLTYSFRIVCRLGNAPKAPNASLALLDAFGVPAKQWIVLRSR